MEVERLEVLGVNVADLDSARLLFGELFGLTFEVFEAEDQARVEVVAPTSGVLHPDSDSLADSPTRIAIDTSGFFELVESDTAAGVRNIHFKVSDLERAISHAQRLGMRLVANVRVGGLREAIFSAEDSFGVRICFVEYRQHNMVDALRAEGPLPM